MRKCDCGSVMGRIEYRKLKLLGQWKVRMRCRSCNTVKAYYFDQEPVFKAVRSDIGRPFYELVA